LGDARANQPVAGTVNTAQFLAMLQRRWGPQAAGMGHHFALIAPDLPATLRTDLTALDRILTVLLIPALAHMPPGQITLTFKMPGPDVLAFSVRDEGPLEAHGLTTVNQLVAAMGGEITLRKHGPTGAECTVCLPMPIADHDTATLAPPPDLSGLHVLIVGDSAQGLDLLADLAAFSGAKASVAENLASAMQQIAAAPPDLLILNAHLTGTFGPDFMSQVQVAIGPDVPLAVLALIDPSSQEAQVALLSAGAAGVLTKPVLCPVELGRAILAALPQADAQEAKSTEVALHKLTQIAGPEAAAELFLRLREDLQSARDGLRGAARRGDLGQIRAHSHVIIALAGTAGAAQLHQHAVVLNTKTHDGVALPELARLAAALDPGLRHLIAAVARASHPAGVQP
jgi:CheY-like chemotaxis protein